MHPTSLLLALALLGQAVPAGPPRKFATDGLTASPRATPSTTVPAAAPAAGRRRHDRIPRRQAGPRVDARAAAPLRPAGSAAASPRQTGAQTVPDDGPMVPRRRLAPLIDSPLRTRPPATVPDTTPAAVPATTPLAAPANAP